jgi:hypothetical protein
MAKKQIEYDSESVRKAAQEKGFTIEFNPLIGTPLLIRDTALNRNYFHLSGGRGRSALGAPRGAGRSTVYSLLRRSAREQWKRDYRDEWTLLRKKGSTYEFIDHYVCNQGKTRFTAGTFSEKSKYPDRIPKAIAEHPSFNGGEGFMDAVFGGNYGRATGLEDYKNPVLHPITEKDKMVLELRDIRWENYRNTKRSIDWFFGPLLTIQLGSLGTMAGSIVAGIIDPTFWKATEISSSHAIGYGLAGIGALAGLGLGIKMMLDVKKDKRAEKTNTLEELLFNEDVIEYLCNS